MYKDLDPQQHDGQNRASRNYPPGVPGASEARQAEIPHQLEKLERTLKGCMQGLEILGERLAQSVMRSEPPSAGSNKTEPSSIQSTSVGSQLQAHVNVAAEINARIQSMYDRLEV